MKVYQTAFVLTLLVALTACGNMAKQYQRGVIPAATKPAGSEIARTQALIKKGIGDRVTLSQSGNDYNRSKQIVRRLSRAAGLGSWSYPVYIADAGKAVNAMAVNDNTIVVYKQLIRNVGSNNTLLAVVLGHEVAHILNRHGKDNTSQNRSAGVAIGAEILGAIISARTGSANAGAAARDLSRTVGVGALVRPYGRSMELEADHVGMLLMAKAGYNPRTAITFWNNSGKYLGSSGGPSFLSTHPSPGNRRGQLQDTLPLALRLYKK